MRLRHGRLAAVLLLAAGSVWVGSSPASAAEDFVYDVTRNASPYRDIPGTAITFTATAGEASYLWARNLSVQNVTPLGVNDNVGNTLAITCRGAAAPASGEIGAYWATNLVPPAETTVTPTLRWRFVAPADGAYTCLLSVTSYSTIITGGRSVRMRIPADASLARATYPASASWTLQAADAKTIPVGTTVTTLGITFTPSITGADRIAVVQDAALTTCVQGSAVEYCSGGSSTGTTVTTWIEAQPQTSTGAPCGVVKESPRVSRFISNAKHHYTAANTLYLNESELAGCAKLRLTLKVRNAGGNPVRLHAGLAAGRAATHGVAFEY